jgi:hypothetical protein
VAPLFHQAKAEKEDEKESISAFGAFDGALREVRKPIESTTRCRGSESPAHCERPDRCVLFRLAMETREVFRRSTVLVLGMMIVPLAVAQVPPVPGESAAPEALPKLFVAERALDLGSVIQGDKKPMAWVLENRGRADLVIKRIKSDCGCAVVELKEAEKVIPPGGSLTLRGEFLSAGRRGPQSKRITVYTNDPVEPELRLSLKVTIKLIFELKPSSGVLNLRSIQRGNSASHTLDVIRSKDMPAVEILSIEGRPGGPFSFRHEPFVDERKSISGCRVFVTVSREAPIGPISESATLKVKVGETERERKITVRANITGELSFRPVILDTTRKPRPLRRGHTLAAVTIQSEAGAPFAILDIDAGPLFSVSLEGSGGKPNSSTYEIRLTVKDDAPAGPFGTLLTVRTDSLDQPFIRIPVYGRVADLVEVEPPMVLLRQDGSEVGMRRSIKLQADLRQTLDIVGVTCDNAAITASVNMERSAWYKHLRYLDVHYAGQLPKGNHETTLKVSTNVPGAETVEIPVTIMVP